MESPRESLAMFHNLLIPKRRCSDSFSLLFTEMLPQWIPASCQALARQKNTDMRDGPSPRGADDLVKRHRSTEQDDSTKRDNERDNVRRGFSGG